MLEVRLLGNFDIRRGKKTVSIPSRPAQSLFAFLILNPGKAFRREKLAGQLWPESTEESARDYLRHALWRIRKALPASSGSYLQSDDLTISFHGSSDYWLDAAALRDAKETGPIDQLAQALAGYAGELLPGFYDEWVVLEREHLQAVYERKVGCLLDLLDKAGRWQDVLVWAEKWIALGQKPESAYRQLMSAHAALGDLVKVATTFERCMKSLAKFGIEPSEETRNLYEDLKAGKRPARAEPKPMQAKQAARGFWNVPNPLTSFIGREKETADVVRLLQENRLVTLTGAGGVGKTRLAIEVAKGIRSKCKNGVCWIELSPLADPNLVPQAIASALEVRESPGQSLTGALMQYLASKQLLLILDNCEHVILACAQIVESLAGACPHLRILTTSREALRIPGEMVHDVPVLSVPKPQYLRLIDPLIEYESVRLFVERAQAVKPGFELTEQNAAAVYQICQQLDGIPLALELAAARTKLLNVEHIATRLNDRFTLLTEGNRTALPRHQTLRAMIDWSYDLLPEDARVLFRRISVFAGGFTMEAAESICADAPLSSQIVLDVLARLADRSLIKMDRLGVSERYSMLETIREYAGEKLEVSGEADQVRQRHRDYFIGFAERAAPELKRAEQLAWLDQVEVEHDNLRCAWDSAIESQPELALRLALALLDFWLRRGTPIEGREWSSKLLERTSHWGQTTQRARALGAAGWLAFFQDDFPAARQFLDQSLILARTLGDQKHVAFVLQWLGWTLFVSSQDTQTAQAYLEECLAISQELQDEWGIAMAFYNLSANADFQGRYAEAEELGMESLRRFQVLGDRYWAGAMLNSLGENARVQGNYEQARTFYEQSLKENRASLGRRSIAVTTGNLAWAVLQGGDDGQAKALFQESLRFATEMGNQVLAIVTLPGFAAILGRGGKAEQAVRLFGAAETLLEVIGVVHGGHPADRMEFEKYLAFTRGQVDEATFAKAWALGCKMTLEQATAFALEETRG
jgi:predicted ATPase/DNA-binding SARP family transcriptional activator